MPIVNMMNFKKKINIDFVTMRQNDTKKLEDVLRSIDIDFTHKSAVESATTKVSFSDEATANKVIQVYEDIKQDYQNYLEKLDPQINLEKELFEDEGLKKTSKSKWSKK